MKRLHKTTACLIGIAWMLTGTLAAEEPGLTFHAGFDKGVDADFAVSGDGKATQVKTQPMILTPLTEEGKGASSTGKGVVIAKDNLSDFKKDVMRTPAQPIRGLNYETQGILNPEEGTIDFWVKPYFNQIEPYGTHAPQNIMLGYLFESRKTEPPLTGLSISLLVESKSYVPGTSSSLTINFATEDGSKGILTTSPLQWEPKTWHRVTFKWNKDTKMLFLDGEKKAEREKTGQLIFGKTFTVGASPWFNKENVLCDFSCVSQCVFDEIRIYNVATP